MDIKLKAKEFAINAHKGQYRKSEINKCMIIHPINVACILESYGFDDNVVAAGYLHDVVEDTKYTLNDILNNFKEDIASLVEKASEPDKTLSWEERKNHTINECTNLDLRHKAVIAADKINNLEDLERLINTKEGFDFSNFKRGFEDQKWYYTKLCENITKDETHPIFKKLKELVYKVFENNYIKEAYLTKERFNKLRELHYLKYEIKSIKNTLDKKPFVIEFTGTPRTGKTTIINNLEEFFKKGGYKVCVLEEFTTSKYYKENIKPKLENKYKSIVNIEIPKYVNMYLDEAISKDYDIILIDRSLFDRCIWIDRLKSKNGIKDNEVKDYYEKYIPLIKEKIDIVVATYCSSLEAMKRDYEANLSLEKRSFLNKDNINEYNTSLKNTINLFENNNYKVSLYETNKSLKDTEYIIAKDILNKMKEIYYNEFIDKYKEN